LCAGEQLRESGTVVEVEEEERGTYLTVGSPIKFSDCALTITGAPLLGEQTDEVLAELGYDADTIAKIHAQAYRLSGAGVAWQCVITN
jgi:formyl-CoA transferase